MPPPPEPKPIIKEPPKVISKSKIFKCMECHRGFKREIKPIKHVIRKHGKNKTNFFMKNLKAIIPVLVRLHAITK